MKIMYFIACSIMVLLFCGCQNSVNTVEAYEKSMQPNNRRDSRFVTDGFLKDRLGIGNLREAQTLDGFLRVQVSVTNLRTGFVDQFWSSLTGQNPAKIRYKFTWFDSDGIEVPHLLANWRTFTLAPGETKELHGIAPDTRCKDFRLSLREAD